MVKLELITSYITQFMMMINIDYMTWFMMVNVDYMFLLMMISAKQIIWSFGFYKSYKIILSFK